MAAWSGGAVLVGVFVIYLVTSFTLRQDGFWINDNALKSIQVDGILRSGFSSYSLDWPGRSLDPDFRYRPIIEPFGHVVDGKLYCSFSPFFALISSWPYRVLGPMGRNVVPLTASLLLMFGVRRLAKRGSCGARERRSVPWVSLLVIALCTPVWFYSETFWEHVPAVCGTTWSVVFLLRYLDSGGVRGLIPMSICCAAAIYFRDELYLWPAVLLIVAYLNGARRRWHVFHFLFWTSLALVPLWCFQWIAIAAPLGHHFRSFSAFEGGAWGYLASRWPAFWNLFLASHEHAWVSVMLALPCVVLFCAFPRINRGGLLPVLIALSTFSLLSGCVAMAGHIGAASPMAYLLRANGLFAVAPVLFFGLVRVRRSTVRDGELDRWEGDERFQKTLWLTAIVFSALYVAFVPVDHTAGLHWGCRHLLPLFPLLGVLAGRTITRCWFLRTRGLTVSHGLVCGVLTLSMLFQCYSMTLLSRRKTFSARLNEAVSQRPEEVVVTTSWFLPQELAGNFFSKKLFLVRSRPQWQALKDQLEHAGIRNALLIEQTSPTQPVSTGSERLDDGLGFLSLELRRVELTE
jgi:hypothetical protein